MNEAIVDEEGRVILPKRLRQRAGLAARSTVTIRVVDDRIILVPHRGEKKDSLIWLLEHPAHVDSKKLKKIDLEQLKDEMWLP
ncbi:MAG TPA: AbrB/MazE/SpoVT family DNA-binding domain-containing protein [archaeon]|nr:AbrB/MazE/SpoVT family DNA-binding domain-containing protein [archaeon]